MSSSDDDRKDYEVGYGKPPKHTRWHKGQSGNPSGKRKRDEGLREKLKRICGEEISVHHNGSPTVMRQDEAMIRSAMAKATKANVAAIKAIAPFLETSGPADIALNDLVPEQADLDLLQTQADFLGLIERAQADLRSNATEDDDDEGAGDGPANDF